MACSLNWIPDTLYNYSIASVMSNFDAFEKDIKLFHGDMLFDVFLQFYKEGELLKLAKEYENLEIFSKLLKVSDKRNLLHNAFQAVMDIGYPLALNLANNFKDCCLKCLHSAELKTIHLGFSLGSFLMDAGWYLESETVIHACLVFSKRNSHAFGLSIIFECLKRLLKVRTFYCKFKEAEETVQDILYYIELTKKLGFNYYNFSALYSEFSALYFVQTKSGEAYKWSEEALKSLDSTIPFREVIGILCNASKACLMKKHFKKSEFLIKQALAETRKYWDNQSLMMADVLMNYGYYLLHIDSVYHSITVYQEVLKILTSILGGQNLKVAAVHEDMAYACYVNEYKTGKFKDARDHVEKASSIKEQLLPEDHFLLPSTKRIKALILEEIALDSLDIEAQDKLFAGAEELHLFALRLTKHHLGTMNVLTAKHYGNLGRLYQSMKRYKDAEKMHLKAIDIKSSLLGDNDYEVAISLGHLASLYNYDMQLYSKAEVLHLKSIEIGIDQFGKSYSGLEFEYRGLIRIYSQMGEYGKAARLHSDLQDWKALRDETIDSENKTSPFDIKVSAIPPEEIHYFLTTT